MGKNDKEGAASDNLPRGHGVAPGAEVRTLTPAVGSLAEGVPLSPADAKALRRAHYARVATDVVQKAIVERLRHRRIPLQEVPIVASDVTVALFEMKDIPPDEPRCVWAARDIADKKAASFLRVMLRSERRVVPIVDEASEPADSAETLPIAPQAVVHEQQHRTIETSLADGTVDARTALMLALQADGKSIAEIAQALGIAPKTVRNALTAGRNDIRAAWRRHAFRLGLLLALGLVVTLAFGARVQMALGPKLYDITPDDSSTARPTGPDPRAAQLRAAAQKRCDARDVIDCEAQLDEAERLDPAGESAPAVQAMRKIIEGERPPKVPDDPRRDDKDTSSPKR